MRPLSLLPLAFLSLLGCEQEADTPFDSQRADSASVKEIVGVWCPTADTAPFVRLKLMKPAGERRDEGSFETISPLITQADPTKAITRVLQSGNYYAYENRLVFNVTEQRIWSDATGEVSAAQAFDLNKSEWNYAFSPKWLLEKEYVIHGLELTPEYGGDTFSFLRDKRNRCRIDLDQ